jgi:hypothetical protein
MKKITKDQYNRKYCSNILEFFRKLGVLYLVVGKDSKFSDEVLFCKFTDLMKEKENMKEKLKENFQVSIEFNSRLGSKT